MKHRYSRSPVTFNNSTISGDDTIVSGNFTSASAPDILDRSEVDVNFNSGAVKTSTKRGNMEEDLKNVWDLLSLAYKKQKERERSYLKHDSKSRRYSLDDTLEIEKPDDDNNKVTTKGKGVLPVAILTTDDFDASTVDASTLSFGPGGAAPAHSGGHLEDVDGDGDLDLMLHFRTQEHGLASGDTEACISGMTLDGTELQGCDSVDVK